MRRRALGLIAVALLISACGSVKVTSHRMRLHGGALISQGLHTYSTGRVVYPVSNMVTSSYGEFRCTPACAGIVDVSSVPAAQRANDIITWYNESNTFDDVAERVNAYNEPKDFTIDMNSAPGGGPPPTTGWVTAANVKNNVYDAGQYVVSLTEYNWVRMEVTASNGSAGNTDATWHMDITTCSSTCAVAGSAKDTWLFLGDSITNNSMTVTPTSPPNYMQSVHAADPRFYPSAVNGGMSFWLSSTFLSTNPSTGRPYIEDFLHAFPSAHFVTLNLGSNDIGTGVAASTYLANMEILVQHVIKAGRVPIVPTIPWAPAVCNTHLNKDNPGTVGTANYLILNTLYKKYPHVLHGPDLWTYFHDNPSLIAISGSPGCPHPTAPVGENAYRTLWATTMGSEVYGKSALR